MKSFTFRQYKRSPKEDSKDDAGDPKDKESASYLKRREQVRRAQRTHRERKENYIKSLENEVLQLRTHEAKMTQENSSLQREIARLRQLLDQNGIPYVVDLDIFTPVHPLGSPSSAAPSSSPISILENPNHQQQLHVGLTGDFYLTESEESQLAASTNALRRKHSFFRRRGRSESTSNDESNTSRQVPSPADISTVTQSTSRLNIREMNTTDLGMEFVLTLEAPCLHHIQGESPNSHDPTGHALTASAALLHHSPTQPVDTHTTATPFSAQHHQWDTPHIGLEKLLELSSKFELSDEITPVQAWNTIRAHPDFENAQLGSLRGLTQDLLKHVKCHGFGAVVHEEFFWECFGRVFPSVGAAF